MYDLVHVSFVRLGNGAKFGGVPMFSSYLKQALPNLVELCFRDMPNWADFSSKLERDLPDVFARWLLKERLIGDKTTVVADGYWGSGLEGKVNRLISVAHGSYYGRLIQSQINPWGEPVDFGDVQKQLGFWHLNNVEIVAVCKTVKEELHKAGITKEIAVINNGVDTNVYGPLGGAKKLYMYSSDMPLKGGDIIGGLKALIRERGLEQQYPIVPFDEFSGDPIRKRARINKARAFLFPSHYEGNPYMALEVMACDVPIIAHKVGAFCEISHLSGFLTDDLSVSSFYRLLGFLDYVHFYPRRYVMEQSSFVAFSKNWQSYLEM